MLGQPNTLTTNQCKPPYGKYLWFYLGTLNVFRKPVWSNKDESVLTSSFRPVPGERQQQRRQTGGLQPQIDAYSSGGTGRRGECTASRFIFMNNNVYLSSLQYVHILVASDVKATMISKPVNIVAAGRNVEKPGRHKLCFKKVKVCSPC